MWYGSSMNYDEQIKKWAAAKTGAPADIIESVEFELEDGRWYSEYTYDEGYAQAAVRFKKVDDYRRANATIGLDRYDFGATIREIMEA